MKTLHFYFDFLSPYAFFASKRVEAFCEDQGLNLVWRPIPLGIVLRHWGHLGPAEIPPKLEHTIRDCLRYAAKHDLAFGMPAKHPFNPMTALRSVLAAGPDASKVVHALFDAGWKARGDLQDPETLVRAMTEAGLDGESIIRATQDPDVKAALKKNSGEGIAAGVFGVPSFVIDGTLFWGNDQFDVMARWLSDGDPFDESTVQALYDTPSAFE